MMMLKRSLIAIILLAGQFSQADCQSDCRDALGKADKLITSLKEEVSVYKNITEAQTNTIANLTTTNNEKSQELAAWYRNPWLVGTIGILVGAGGTLYLLKK